MDCNGSLVLSQTTNNECVSANGAPHEAAYMFHGEPLGVSCSVGTSTVIVNIGGEGTICCP
jgi:hypothetical protein